MCQCQRSDGAGLSIEHRVFTDYGCFNSALGHRGKCARKLFRSPERKLE
jgi:hypothetical protein